MGLRPWEMVGLLTFLDPPRPDTKDTIEKAQAFGVEVSSLPTKPCRPQLPPSL